MAQLKSTNIFGTLEVQALTQSISTSTGALIVAGGVGIKKDIYIGRNANVAGNETVEGTLAVTGAVTGLKFNNLTITSPANGSVLTITDGKTLTVSTNKTLAGAGTTLTLGGNLTTSGAHTTTLITTGNTSITLPTIGTLSTLAGEETLTNKTLTSPILTTPTLGIASATSINKVIITAPATGSTLTIAEGKTLEVNTGNVTLKGNASNSTLTLPITLTLGASTAGGIIYGGTNAYTSTGAGSAGQALLSGGVEKPTWTSGTLSIANTKSATFSNSLTVSGADKTFDGTGTKLTLAGAFTTTLTTTANTNVTLPTTGTLAVIGGKLSQFAATTSSELAGVISDETGTGALVFGTSPTLTTSLTTGSTSFDLLNTTATTLNIGGASTTINMGAATGTTTVNNDLVVGGNLTISGTTTTFNTEILTVEDKNIELGKVTTPTNATANLGGITLLGGNDGNKTIIWNGGNWTSSEHWDIATDKTYKINNVTMLSATALGSTVTDSSLTSVGVLTSGTVPWSLLNGVPNYAGSSSVGGSATSANKVNNSLVLKFASGTEERKGLVTFDGSKAKTLDIKSGSNISIDKTVNDVITINATDTIYSVGDGGLTEKNFTSTLKTKLDGIATGATVNVSTNLSTTHSATTVVVNSSDGDNATINGATASAAGVVTTGEQTFAGKKTLNGDFTADKVYNAVWNDIADFLEVDEDIDIEYGKAYFRDNNGKVRKTNKRNSYSIGIASDTFGFGVGRKDENIKQIPIAIGGWVLACVDNIYKAGTAMVASKNGILKKASILDKILFPERIIAIFDRAEKEETWNGVEVKGRHWVKVK